MDYSYLKIKYIPALFPNVDFTDIHVISDVRIVKLLQPEILIIQTEKKYKTVSQRTISTEQIIQSVKYDKYYIEIYSFENNEFNNIQLAENILIVDELENIHTVKLLNIDVENVEQNTTLYVTRLTFASLQDDDIIVNSYKTSDYISLKNTENYNLKLTNVGSNPIFGLATEINFYTEFLPEQKRSEIQISEQELPDGRKLISSSIDALETKIKFILTTYEFTEFMKVIHRVNLSDIDLINATDVFSISPSERMQVIINENNQLIDLYDIDLIIHTDVIKFYNFA
jgi:hypothetical protein